MLLSKYRKFDEKIIFLIQYYDFGQKAYHLYYLQISENKPIIQYILT